MDSVRDIEPPVAPRHMVRSVKELRGLLNELIEVSDAGDLWGVRVLRRHVEIALDGPTVMTSAQNQVDFVVQLLDAMSEACESGFGGLRSGPTWEETGRRHERLEQLRDRLSRLADELGETVDLWQRRRQARRA